MDEIINGMVIITCNKKDEISKVLPYPKLISEEIIEGLKSKFSYFLNEKGPSIKKIDFLDFPSQEMKALSFIYDLEKPESENEGKKTVYYIFFKEQNDVIFYKYKDGIGAILQFFGDKIDKAENKKQLNDHLSQLQGTLTNELNQYREKELAKRNARDVDLAEKKRNIDYRFKIIVCGDRGVGKTSSVLRFTKNAFNRNYLPTIGANITKKNVLVDDRLIQLIIWDIGGQNKFDMMRTHFYEGSEGIFLMFDLTVQSSLENISNWQADIMKNLKRMKNAPIGFIIGNKKDLINLRKIKKDEAKFVSDGLGLEYMETSALTGENVEKSFIKLAKMLLLTRKEMSTAKTKFDFFK